MDSRSVRPSINHIGALLTDLESILHILELTLFIGHSNPVRLHYPSWTCQVDLMIAQFIHHRYSLPIMASIKFLEKQIDKSYSHGSNQGMLCPSWTHLLALNPYLPTWQQPPSNLSKHSFQASLTLDLHSLPSDLSDADN